jgi:hypothetical protein
MTIAKHGGPSKLINKVVILFLYPLEKVVNNFLELTNQTKPTEKF